MVVTSCDFGKISSTSSKAQLLTESGLLKWNPKRKNSERGPLRKNKSNPLGHEIQKKLSSHNSTCGGHAVSAAHSVPYHNHITTGYTQAAVTWTCSTSRLNVRLSDPFSKHNIIISRAPHFAKMRWVWVVQNDRWMTPWYSYSPGNVGKSKLPKNHMTINDILHWYPLVFLWISAKTTNNTW